MNLDLKIHKALNKFVKKSEVENEYFPEVKVSKTVTPEEDYSFNEVFENVHKQLKLEL